MRLISANALATTDVQSPAGETVGTVVDCMLDTERGAVVYAVLAVGGVLGVGAKMLAIPPQSLTLDGTGQRLKLGIDTAVLEAARGFDRANPPERADGGLLASSTRSGTPRTSGNQGERHG